MRLSTNRMWFRLLLLMLHIFTSQQTKILQIARIANEFGFKLARKVSAVDDNYILSPLNIFTAMCMMYLGVTGNLEKELNMQLQMLDPEEEDRFEYDSIHLNLQYLLFNVGAARSKNNMSLAHGWFLQEEYQLSENYEERLKLYYPNSTICSVDFARNGTEAVRVINEWVTNRTCSKVNYLLSMPFEPSPQVALFNVAYFKGLWKTKFPYKDKIRAKFYKSDNETEIIRYMSLKDQDVQYFEEPTSRYKFISLPYYGDTIDFLLGLPPKYGQANLTMTQEMLTSIQDSLQTRRLDELLLPKFLIEYAKDLSGPFKRLFFKLLRTSGFIHEKGCNDSATAVVKTFPFLHRAVVEVTERGANEHQAPVREADDVTEMSKPPKIIVNHPFLFYIIERTNSAVLFCGRFASP